MKILIISDLYPNKANLHSASFIVQRLEEYTKKNIDFAVYSILHYDSPVTAIIKKITGRKPVKAHESFDTGCYKWNYINIPNTFLRLIINNLYDDSERYFTEIIKMNLNPTRYDLVICHFAYPAGYYGKMIKKFFNIPCIIFAHGTDIHTAPFATKALADKTADALNKADHCVFVSNKLRETAGLFGFHNNNYSIIPNGINPALFNLDGINKSGKTVGFVGNLINVKGADRLPEIFGKIKEKDENIKFIVVGNGLLYAGLKEEFARRNIQVEMPGAVKHSDVPGYLKRMDVLVLPSRKEGWGCIIIEANACGVYCIGTEAGGIPEAVSTYGTVIEGQENLESRFADETIKVLNMPKDLNALNSYANQYSWEIITEKEINLITKVLE